MDAIEERISFLELKLLGRSMNGSSAETQQNAVASTNQLIDQLVDANNKIGNALKGREKLSALMETTKVDAMHRYMDPLHADEVSLTPAAKLQIINSSIVTLEDRLALLEEVEKLRPVLDSEHLAKAPELVPKLCELQTVQFKQHITTEAHNADAAELIKKYNCLVHSISRQFVAWDALVTQAELKKGIVTTDES